MVTIKKENEIALIREGGHILSGILKKIAAEVKPGVKTDYLEKMACDLIKQAGGRPAFKGYKTFLDDKGFPTALCTSINDEVVHAPAIPGRVLNEGDIIGIDVGMEYPIQEHPQNGKPYNKLSKKGGFYTDMAITVPVGNVGKDVQKLIDVTKKSLDLGIAQVKPGNTLNDIGRAIQKYAEAQGFSVVRDLVGHGVGFAVHEDPQVPNYEVRDRSMKNVTLKSGMVIAIEPMVNMGSYEIMGSEDGFTIVTTDESLSAHFEHTVVVTNNGCEILTKF